jgi:Ca-activated chloride channel family protein
MPQTNMQIEESVWFGLISVSGTARVVLPLKAIDCEFTVEGGLVEVRMRQVFRQENRRALDCDYLFPLPADASVYACEADINGRVIRAQAREREEARELAAQKMAEGHRVALVEAERQNLFTLTLSNLQPDDLILVDLRYIQPLRRLGELVSVEIPLCPGMRYIPGEPLLRSNRGRGTVDDTNQVPDASRITPVRMEAEHPDAACVAIRGELTAGVVKQSSIVSPSHALETTSEGEKVIVTLGKHGEVPDRDFVVRWEEASTETVAPRAWVQQRNGETYALLEIRAPKTAPARREPMDFYFLVDRSGSMARAHKWDKAVEALQSCVDLLAPEDRAMITLFETAFRDFAERPLPVKTLRDDPRFGQLQQVGTAGGTNLGPALAHVLDVANANSAGRRKCLILITDAQVGNEEGILRIMNSARDFPVHCFGIDVTLNDQLLLALSRQQGGTFHSLNPNDDIRQAVTGLAKLLGQPVLLDLRLDGAWETAEPRIPDLYAGQVHYLSARAPRGRSLELTAANGRGRARIQFEQQPAAGAGPYLHWCQGRIRWLMAENKSKEAVALSVASNLICELTAFVAWDAAEKVAVATHHLTQPSVSVAGALGAFACAEPRRSHGFRLFSRARLNETRVLFRAVLPDAVAEAPLHYGDDPLRMELLELCAAVGCAECVELGARIVAWAFDRNGRVADRLATVEKLINDLRALVTELKRLRHETTALARDLVRALREAADALARLAGVPDAPGPRDSGEPFAAVTRAKDLLARECLERNLRQVKRLEEEVLQTLREFVSKRKVATHAQV